MLYVDQLSSFYHASTDGSTLLLPIQAAPSVPHHRTTQAITFHLIAVSANNNQVTG